jgi:hypothetical protein
MAHTIWYVRVRTVHVPRAHTTTRVLSTPPVLDVDVYVRTYVRTYQMVRTRYHWYHLVRKSTCTTVYQVLEYHGTIGMLLGLYGMLTCTVCGERRYHGVYVHVYVPTSLLASMAYAGTYTYTVRTCTSLKWYVTLEKGTHVH